MRLSPENRIKQQQVEGDKIETETENPGLRRGLGLLNRIYRSHRFRRSFGQAEEI
jgi:hypothetical protein